MYPYIYINAIDLELPTYGLCSLVGAVVALIVILRLRKRTILSEDNILDGIIFAILFGLLGAKILYLIKDPPIFPLTWDDIKEILTTGLVFYGGLLGGLGGLALASLKTKKPFVTFTDTIAPGFCFAHAFGRIGCLCAGCCYGVEMEGFLCLELGGTSRLAVQLMEAVFLILLGLFLCLLHRKKPRRGTLTGLYMVLYAIWRFVIEFWRDDDRGFIGELSTSQFIGIFIFAAGIIILFLAKKYGWPKDFLTAEAGNAAQAPAAEEPAGSPAEEAQTPDAEEQPAAEEAGSASGETENEPEPPVVENTVPDMASLIAGLEGMKPEERDEALREKSQTLLPALAKQTGDPDKARELYCTFVLGALLADGRLADEEYPLVKPMLQSFLGEDTDIDTCRERLTAAADKTELLKENADLLIDAIGENDPALKNDCVLTSLLLCSVDGKVSPEEQAYIAKLTE